MTNEQAKEISDYLTDIIMRFNRIGDDKRWQAYGS